MSLKNKAYRNRFLVLFVFLGLLAACNLETPNTVATMVAQTLENERSTAFQAQTQTAASFLLSPSVTATNTLTPTATATLFVPVFTLIPTATITATNTLIPLPTIIAYNKAEWLWQSPVDGTVFKPSEKFTMTYKIQNTGNKAWSPNYYLHVVQGYNQSLYYSTIPLGRWVYPGEIWEISFASHAPAEENQYYSVWKLADDLGKDFYTVDLTFSVKKETPTQTPYVVVITATSLPLPSATKTSTVFPTSTVTVAPSPTKTVTATPTP